MMGLPFTPGPSPRARGEGRGGFSWLERADRSEPACRTLFAWEVRR